MTLKSVSWELRLFLKTDDTICKDNIKLITQSLKEKNISVRAVVLGGMERKNLSLDIKRVSTCYTEGDGQENLLRQSAGKSALR